jgi:hypothetical protein
MQDLSKNGPDWSSGSVLFATFSVRPHRLRLNPSHSWPKLLRIVIPSEERNLLFPPPPLHLQPQPTSHTHPLLPPHRPTGETHPAPAAHSAPSVAPTVPQPAPKKDPNIIHLDDNCRLLIDGKPVQTNFATLYWPDMVHTTAVTSPTMYTGRVSTMR